MPRPQPRPRRRRTPIIRDPLLPLSEQQIRRQTTRDVRSQVDPIIAELTRSLNARAAAGSRNIEGVTNRLAQSLGGYEQRVGDIYGQARQQLGGLDTELANRLAASGQGSAETLAASLRQAGLPTEGAAGLAQVGAGAGAAGYASGRAELAQLVQNEASGRTYAAAQPGIARLGGLQGIRELQARKQQELAEQAGEVRSQIPGLVSGLTGEARRREYEKAVAARGFGLDVAKMQQEAAEAAALESGRMTRAQLAEQGRNRRSAATIAAQNQRAAAANAAANARAAATGRKVDMAASRARGYYVGKDLRPILSASGGRMWLPLRSRDVWRNRAKKKEKGGEGASGLGP